MSPLFILCWVYFDGNNIIQLLIGITVFSFINLIQEVAFYKMIIKCIL